MSRDRDSALLFLPIQHFLPLEQILKTSEGRDPTESERPPPISEQTDGHQQRSPFKSCVSGLRQPPVPEGFFVMHRDAVNVCAFIRVCARLFACVHVGV